MHKTTELTAARLRELLDYDKASGLFRWRVDHRFCGFIRAGRIAGGLNSDGHMRIQIDGVTHLAHRLAWLHVMGEWPADEIDHENRVRSDNRWLNLRPATNEQQRRNSSRQSNNTSGFKGVSKDRNGWRARIFVGGRNRGLGTFDTPELAHEMYSLAAAMIHGDFACAGV